MTPAQLILRLLAIAPDVFPSVSAADAWRALIADARALQERGLLK